ncbi:lymphocyte-specific helicase isoform X2 [Magallana gigas]|uniref:lymphocyte-specific helicase isoform X2 n=1 Tax=Magallana gigas TaxID=29159 RepID=UPI00333FE73B
MEEQLTAKIMTKMSGNISPQIPSVEAEEPKEVAKIIEEDHTKGVTENDLEGITKGETFSGNDLTSLKKVEHIEESKEDSCEGVVTTDMLKEEENLENEGKKEEGKFKEEQQKIWDQLDNADRELRYNKLQLLLNKSTVYTQYLIKRMERQKQEDQKRRERLAKKMAKKTQAETSDQKNSTDERRSHRTKNSMYSSPSSSQEKKIGRGRKRKEGVESSDAKPTAKRKKRDPDPQNSTASEGDDVSQESDQINSSTTTQHTKSIADGLSKEEQANSDTEEMLIEETEKKALLEKNDEHPVLFTGGSLRQYQKEGYKWLRTSYENGVNGILADEMGLGKTVQCIAMLAHLIYQGVTGPFLVVAPLSTLPNWYSEFRRFTPKVPVILYHGTPDERTRLRIQIRKTTPIREGVNVQPVVITSYEITMRDRTSLQSHDWKILIVDEGHRIKNTHCRLIRELRMYGNTHRLLLTGTPLQNNLAELWSLLNFLLPEIFDDLGSFEMWFDVERLSLENAEEKIVKEEQQKNILSMLHQILTPFMLRRLKQDVELKLPPKKELLVYAPMSSLQQEYYTSTVDKTIMDKIQEKCKEPEFIEYDSNGRPVRKSRKKTVNYSLLDEKDDGCSDSDLEEDLEKWFNVVQDSSASYTAKEKVPAKSVVTIRMQNIMMQLRKCCNHPYLLEYPLTEGGDYKIDEDLVQTCGKMKLLDAMLAELKLRKHKVLIFSQMTKMLDILQDFCWLRKYKFCRLDGSTSIQERQEQMADFNSNPEVFIFLLSTRAGGLGINLVGADTVIIYDSDWNPQCDLQAQDRCHRIGQSKPVVIYRLVTTNTIDQRIVERAAAKRKLEKMVIHKGRFKSGMENFSDKCKPLSPQELMELLKAKDHENEVKDVDNLSKEALDSLLDRSDLYAKWKDQEEAHKSHNQGTKGKKPKKQQKTSVFSVIDEEI